MKALLQKFFDITFLKFLLVGVANTLFGTGIMYLFYNVFHLNYWLSTASNYVFGSILSYVLNRCFTFRSSGPMRATLPRFILNIAVCYLLAYGAARPLMRYLLSNASASVQENLAMLVGLGFFVCLNYFGQRWFVFREKAE